MKRAICHEAGHAVVALHLGFRVEKIEVSKGLPRAVCDLAPQRTPEDRCILLAGGIAGELCCGHANYDQEACRSDQSGISEIGGSSIEDYLPQAKGILRSREALFCEFRKETTRAWVEGEALSAFGPDPNSFEILSEQKIAEIWNRS